MLCEDTKEYKQYEMWVKIRRKETEESGEEERWGEAKTVTGIKETIKCFLLKITVIQYKYKFIKIIIIHWDIKQSRETLMNLALILMTSFSIHA